MVKSKIRNTKKKTKTKTKSETIPLQKQHFAEIGSVTSEYSAIYTDGSKDGDIVLYRQLFSTSSEISFSAMRPMTSYLRSTIGDERLSNLSLVHVHRHVQVDLNMIIHKLIHVKNYE